MISGDDSGREQEISPTRHPRINPKIIHSGEENIHTKSVNKVGSINPSINLPGVTKRPPQIYIPSTRAPTTHYPPYQPPPQPPASMVPRPSISTTTSTYDIIHNYDDYDVYPDSNLNFPPDPLPPEINEPGDGIKSRPEVQSEIQQKTSLIISIVAGILIVIILIILIVLKCKGRNDTRYKVDESKNYSSLSQGPTMIVNGQGNGQMKPGDRRPIKKQSKDVKEWYV